MKRVLKGLVLSVLISSSLFAESLTQDCQTKGREVLKEVKSLETNLKNNDLVSINNNLSRIFEIGNNIDKYCSDSNIEELVVSKHVYKIMLSCFELKIELSKAINESRY